MASNPSTSLLSAHKASDSGLQIHLHPLVLLTISDYITRHTLRRNQGPIVGALLGQQNGRDISLEHAFECEVVQGNNGVILHETWFKDRLQQHKDVHKAPALELVGWFTTAPTEGPQLEHIPIHQQILHTYNETAVLLAFHPSTVLEGATVGGKLPLTIYESVYESEKAAGQTGGDGDRAMEVDGPDSFLDLRFRELPYTVETGEAEMISVDFVARGGGNATAADGPAEKGARGQASQTPVGEAQTKEAKAEIDAKGVDDASILSPEDEELIASLTARANAVKMLHSRIQLLRTYLSTLPPSPLTTPTPDLPSLPPQHHPLLRSIQALLSRLPLLTPPNTQAFTHEALSEKNDVSLVALLGSLSRSVKDAREMGQKFAVVEMGRVAAGRKMGVAGVMGEEFFGGGTVDPALI